MLITGTDYFIKPVLPRKKRRLHCSQKNIHPGNAALEDIFSPARIPHSEFRIRPYPNLPLSCRHLPCGVTGVVAARLCTVASRNFHGESRRDD